MMDHGMQSLQEKLFNLQLTVQKQEEELRLYRNGTTSTELFDLIHEKDIEIETWRVKCEEKEEKLKKLARTSGDVLMKYEKLQDDLQALYDEKQAVEESLKRALEVKSSGDHRVKQIEEELAEMRKEIAARDDQVGALRLQLWELQQRMDEQANAHNNTQISLMEAETEVKQLKDYQRDLEAVIADQTQEITELTAESKKWKAYVTDQDASIEKLQKRCATLVAEKAETLRNLDVERQEMIGHVQAFRESMSQNLAQRDEALKRREAKIRELQFQVSVLQQEAKLKASTSTSTATSSAPVGLTTASGKRVLGERTNTVSAVPAAVGLEKKAPTLQPQAPALPTATI